MQDAGTGGMICAGRRKQQFQEERPKFRSFIFDTTSRNFDSLSVLGNLSHRRSAGLSYESDQFRSKGVFDSLST
jgi:hypothetical protein